ncbi:pectate lyase 1-like [Mangifera indica]|uniref:pectate lyase 1-like n=1 Tax=Mangifera indica TaxID=29780 RepID=UPI001CF9B86E|nr:pectate lyase 1-like [Mangifera indica]
MIDNVGEDMIYYIVTSSNDDPLNPKPGTLRYGATLISQKVWITFQRDMHIKLRKPLLISSFTTIDARGSRIHISGIGCLLIYEANNVIIHGLYIHHCQPAGSGAVIGPNSKILNLGAIDSDAIRLVAASKIWIDHNTLYKCQDGLIDVTLSSTDITISNNWFKNQDKVMLLGHDDMHASDKNMKVTVVFNHFGPNCNQRIPRVRYGFVHIANNLYQEWTSYAIGGSMNPQIRSEANLYIAKKSGQKEVTWQLGRSSKLYSVGDIFENGASFKATGSGNIQPNYNDEQRFQVADANSVRALTNASGVLLCSRALKC